MLGFHEVIEYEEVGTKILSALGNGVVYFRVGNKKPRTTKSSGSVAKLQMRNTVESGGRVI